MYVDRAMYNMKRAVQNFFRELLELLFNAAALVIDTLRTFFLIVLSILGPEMCIRDRPCSPCRMFPLSAQDPNRL